MTPKLANAWIFLNEDDPAGTSYDSPTSCYQALIQNDIYQSVDLLFLCFVTTTPTGANTAPIGDGSSYTIEMGAAEHPDGLTNQDYMNAILRDARLNNPKIKIMVTLEYGDSGDQISRVFSNSQCTDQENAINFAVNLMAYLRNYELDGFDIDWESPLSNVTNREQFALLINAIGTQFKQASDKHYFLTLSPAAVGTLDVNAVNNNVDFINLQLYSGFTDPGEFTGAGVNPALFAYGAKFEAESVNSEQGYQTAEEAYEDNLANYGYSIFTNWRLNSANYHFEQVQQQLLYKLVFQSQAE